MDQSQLPDARPTFRTELDSKLHPLILQSKIIEILGKLVYGKLLVRRRASLDNSYRNLTLLQPRLIPIPNPSSADATVRPPPVGVETRFVAYIPTFYQAAYMSETVFENLALESPESWVSCVSMRSTATSS